MTNACYQPLRSMILKFHNNFWSRQFWRWHITPFQILPGFNEMRVFFDLFYYQLNISYYFIFLCIGPSPFEWIINISQNQYGIKSWLFKFYYLGASLDFDQACFIYKSFCEMYYKTTKGFWFFPRRVTTLFVEWTKYIFSFFTWSNRLALLKKDQLKKLK